VVDGGGITVAVDAVADLLGAGVDVGVVVVAVIPLAHGARGPLAGLHGARAGVAVAVAVLIGVPVEEALAVAAVGLSAFVARCAAVGADAALRGARIGEAGEEEQQGQHVILSTARGRGRQQGRAAPSISAGRGSSAVAPSR